MRLSELMDVEVRDEAGSRIGKVTDVRLEEKGPVVPTTGRTTWALSGLVVGGGGFAHRLGYIQGEVKGPWLLAVLIRRITRKGRFVSWDRVRAVNESLIVIAGKAGDLETVDQVEDGG